MVAYIKLKKLFKRIDREVKEITFASIKGKILYLIVGYFLFLDLSTIVSVRINSTLGGILLFLITVLFAFLVFVNRAGIGLRDDGLTIIHLKRFKVEDKKIYNIPFDKIKSITVSKFGINISLKISFLSEEGILEQKKYGFTTFILGSEERKKYANKIYDKLVEVQKIVDKGDF